MNNPALRETPHKTKPALRLVKTLDLPREDWLDVRKKGIGSSDAAASVGLNPYQSMLELWMIKTGRDQNLPKVDPHDEESPMYWGNILEPIVAAHYTRRTGNRVRKINAVLQHPDPDKAWMLANIDREITGAADVQILECKSAGINGAKLWKDGVPEYVQIQVHHQLAVTGKQAADVAVLLGGQHLEIHRIERDEVLIQNLIKLEREFWHYVETDTPPPADGSESADLALRCLYPNDAGNTPLHRAVATCDYLVVDALINAGADIAARDENGDSLLHRALAWGNCKVVGLVIKAGAPLEERDKSGRTPLHVAAKRGPTVTKQILVRGADVHAVDLEGKTPLHYAHWGSTATALVSRGAKVNVRDYKHKIPLHYAVSARPDVVAALIADNSDVNAVDADGLRPLGLVSAFNPEVALMLLDAGANPESLSRIGEEWDRTLLYGVVLRRKLALIPRLLGHSIDVNEADVNGETALHLAARLNSEPACRALIDGGAKVGALSKAGLTPRDHAINPNVVALLEEHALKERPALPQRPSSAQVRSRATL